MDKFKVTRNESSELKTYLKNGYSSPMDIMREIWRNNKDLSHLLFDGTLKNQYYIAPLFTSALTSFYATQDFDSAFQTIPTRTFIFTTGLTYLSSAKQEDSDVYILTPDPKLASELTLNQFDSLHKQGVRGIKFEELALQLPEVPND